MVLNNFSLGLVGDADENTAIERSCPHIVRISSV